MDSLSSLQIALLRREYAIKKVMTYKNAAFETAKQIMERVSGVEEGVKYRKGGVSSREFLELQKKQVINIWERREVPLEKEVEIMRRGVGLKERKEKCAMYGGIMKRGNKQGEEEKRKERGMNGTEIWRKDYAKGRNGPNMANRYQKLSEEKEVRTRKTKGIEVSQRIPMPYHMVG